MSEPPAIEMHDVTVVYDSQSANEVTALRSVSLSVMRGETVVITGHNGSGKSSVLKAVAGTVPVVSGKVRIQGIDVSSWPAHRRARLLGFIHQDPMMGTCPNLTVLENIRLYSSRSWWRPLPEFPPSKDAKVPLLSGLGLPLASKAHAQIRTLSGGQRQGTAISLALSSYRPILLMDEFSSSLDTRIRGASIEAIAHECRQRDLTILAVTHDSSAFASFNARFIRLSEGTVIQE